MKIFGGTKEELLLEIKSYYMQIDKIEKDYSYINIRINELMETRDNLESALYRNQTKVSELENEYKQLLIEEVIGKILID